MSIVTLNLTDTGKSGVNLAFLRPSASDNVPTLSTLYMMNPNVFNTNTNSQQQQQATNNSNLPPRSSTFTVSTTRSLSPARVGSAGLQQRPASGGAGNTIQLLHNGEEAPAVFYESPLQFNSDVHRPDFIPDEIIIALNDTAQRYGTLLELTRTNSLPAMPTASANTNTTTADPDNSTSSFAPILDANASATDDLVQVKDVCYKYYHQLQVVLRLIEENATDIDCLEEVDQNIAELMAETLYNVALCHFFIGAKRIGDANGRSVAAFTEAAAVIDFLMSSELAHDSEKLELVEDNLRAMSSICMATAHEVSLQYYYSDTFHQVETNANLAHKASYYYTLAAAIVNGSFTIPNREMLLNFCNIKRLFMEGMMMFILGLEMGTTKGDSRRRKALEAFEEAQQHVLRVLPGDRLASEMEITWYIKRCNKFKKIMKKGFMVEGNFTNKRRRTDQYTSTIPMENILPQYPTEIKAIIEAERRRQELEEANGGVSAVAQPNSLFAAAALDGSYDPLHNPFGFEIGSDLLAHCGDDDDDDKKSVTEDFGHVRLNVNAFVNDEDIRLLAPPIKPSATHYHLVTAMVRLDAPSLKPEETGRYKKKYIGDDEFALSVSRSASVTHRSSCSASTSRGNSPGARSIGALGATTTPSHAGGGRAPSTIAEQAQDKSQQPACSHCAALFYIDLNMQDASVRSNARTAIALAIRAARLTEQDRIGVIGFDKYGQPLPIASTTIIPATVDNLARVTQQILDEKVAAKYEGAHGPSLVKGVLSAIEQLSNLEKDETAKNFHNNSSVDDAISSWTGNKNIFVVTDGAGNGIGSDYENWQLFNSKETREKLQSAGVQVHCFGAADAADHELLDGIALASRGNSASHRSGVYDVEKTTMKLTRWFVSGLSSLKQRVASAIDVKLKCPQGILIANVVTDYYKPAPTTQYTQLKNEVTIPILPIAAENETHVLVTFAVPATHTKKDVIELAQGSVDYFDAIRCKPVHHKIALFNVCSSRVLSREIHFWATQMQVTATHGACYLTTPSASRSLLRGGEIAMKLDSVQTSSAERSHVTLVSIEGTRFELGPSTTVLLSDVAVNKITVTLSRGSIKVITANECSVSINVDSTYVVDIAPSSYASASLDQRTGQFDANCIIGNAKITCIDENTNAAANSRGGGASGSSAHHRSGSSKKKAKQEVISLPAPRQTSCIVPDVPTIPWVVDEKTFFPWVDTTNCDAFEAIAKNRLKNTIRIETHVMRTKAAEAMRKVSRLMVRSLRIGTLGDGEEDKYPRDSFISIISRQIVMYVYLTRCKAEITNSIAYSTANKTLDKIRRVLDEYMGVVSGKNRPTRGWPEALFTIENARAVATERSVAGSAVYCPSDVSQQVKVQQSDKTRFALLLAEQREREFEEGKNAERERREILLQPAFAHIDFGAVNRAEVRNLLTILYDMPQLVDAAPTLEDIIITVGRGKSMTEEQFCTLFNHCCAELNPLLFNAFAEVLARRVAEVSKKIESTRITRSLFAIFTAFDFDQNGFLTVPNIVNLFQTVFGDNLQQFKRVEAFIKAVVDARNALIDTAAQSKIIVAAASTATSANSITASATASVANPSTAQPTPVVGPAVDANTPPLVYTKAVPEDEEQPAKDDLAPIPPSTAELQQQGEEEEVEFAKDADAAAPEIPVAPPAAEPAVVVTAPAPPAPGSVVAEKKEAAAATTTSPSSSSSSPLGRHWDRAAIDTIDAVKVTIDVFIAAMADVFLKDLPEATAHAQLAQIMNQIKAKTKCPQTTEGILIKAKLDEELKHLVQWDLRHIFDGIDKKKDIPRVTAAEFKIPEDQEQLFQLICAPVCVLANIDAPVVRRGAGAGAAGGRTSTITTGGAGGNTGAVLAANNSNANGALVPSPPSPTTPSKAARGSSAAGAGGGMMSSYYVDYFAGVQKELREDWATFLKTLQSFPALSISHKQAIRVAQHLKDPRLAPEAVFCKTPIVAQLLTWVRLMLRIAYLTNSYDSAPPIADRLISEAVAIQKKAEALTYITRIADDKKCPATTSATHETKTFATAYKPVFGTKPGIQNEFGFGSVTKFHAEPPSKEPKLGKPTLMRIGGGGDGATGAAAVLARLAENNVQTKTFGILEAAAVDDAVIGGNNNRPTTAPAAANKKDNADDAAGGSSTPNTNHLKSNTGLLSVSGQGPNNRSQLSFRNMENGQQQRLKRQLSSTTTGADASYLKTRGSQLNFGPSVAASASALTGSGNNVYASAGNLTAPNAFGGRNGGFVPMPPKAPSPPPGGKKVAAAAAGGNNTNSTSDANVQQLPSDTYIIETTSVADSNDVATDHNTSAL